MTKTDGSEGSTLARRRRRQKRKLFADAFLDALRTCPIITDAVKKAQEAARYTAGERYLRRLVYKWRDRDKTFQRAWDDALEQGWDRAENAAYSRAVDGVEVPIVDKKEGKIIGHTVEYSDRLLEFMLKGNRAKVYGDRTKVEHEHSGTVTIEHAMGQMVQGIRMRNQSSPQRLESENVRELSAGEAKVLNLNASTIDVMSTGAAKQGSGSGDKAK